MHTFAIQKSFVNMTALEIKNNFLEWIPNESLHLLQPVHYSILDEMVEHCLNGSALFNDRRPETIQEYNTVIGLGMVQTIPIFHSFIKGVKEMYPTEEVDITVNYRGKQFNFNSFK